jgi:DNA-binding GntR family transcriptional regulator
MVGGDGVSLDVGAPLVRETLVAEVAQRLRELILTGKLAAGSRLHQESLSEALGVSRTPLRQALAVLAHEGFVRRGPGSQYRVAEVDRTDLRELYLVRRELDALAAELAAMRRTDAQVAALRDEVQAMGAAGDVAWLDHHRRFHVLIYEAAANRHLLRNTPLVQLSTQLFYPLLLSARTGRVRSHADHERLCAAVAAGDAAGARRAAWDHITRAMSQLDDGPSIPQEGDRRA